MQDFIFFMHDDATGSEGDWGPYLADLGRKGVFDGGSSIGGGLCARKSGDSRDAADHIVGYIRIRAASLEDARTLLQGNPVYEAGGTVEIRELPRD